ncbi:TolC family protein [Segetibacter koreensis]|uniref:TolC family protein n=1 Tax=Segetibacter koreensis TaxID=398037 RepID=UPI0003A5B54E|nr:TolC family protein [Segetibacter koreensis]
MLIAVLVTANSFTRLQIDTTVGSVQMSLSQVWDKAESYNKQIQMQQLHVQGSEEEIKDAKAERLPDISAEGEYARVSNMPLFENGIFKTPTQFPVLHNYYKVAGDAYLNVYNGKKTSTKISENEAKQQIAVEQKRLTTSEIKLRASSYYLDIQRSLVFKDLLLKHLAEQEKQLEQIRQLKKNGVVLKTDVLRAELQLSRQKLSLEQIDNDIAIARQKLDIIIGLPDSVNIIPSADSLDSFPLKNYEDYVADATTHSYQYKISEKETELRLLQLKEVKGNNLPKVGLFANYSYTYPEIQFYPYAPSLYGIGMYGVRATLPISSLYHNKHKEKAAEIEYKRQEIEHSNTQDDIRQQVKEAYLRYKEAVNRTNVAKANIQQATENLRIVSNTYFNQLSLLTDLLDADTQVLQTRFDYAAAKIAAQLQYYQLQKAIGNL